MITNKFVKSLEYQETVKYFKGSMYKVTFEDDECIFVEDEQGNSHEYSKDINSDEYWGKYFD